MKISSENSDNQNYSDSKILKYKVYMIHLEKFAQTGVIGQTGKEAEEVSSEPAENAESNSVKGERWFEKPFFCYGYYDKLSYLEEKEAYFTYEYGFSIKYPYKKAQQPVIADQLFTLLDPVTETETGRQGDQIENPFTTERMGNPFIGLFLVSFSPLQQDAVSAAEQREKHFWETLKELCGKLETCLKKNFCPNTEETGEILKIYYSSNCADLCIALRTGSVEKIFNMKMNLENCVNEAAGTSNWALRSTLYVASETADGINNPLQAEKAQDNGRCEIEIRLNGTEKSIAGIKGRLAGLHRELNGIMGKGEYMLKLSYADFADLYPFYVKMKWGALGQKDLSKREEDKSPESLLRDYYPDIKLSYERWYIYPESQNTETEVKETGELIPQKEGFQILEKGNENGRSGSWKNRKMVCIAMKRAVDSLPEQIGDLIGDMIGNDESGILFPKQRFMEQIQLMKDLLYTYDNLWYNEGTVSEGRVFYAQMSALLEGILQQVNMICTVVKQKQKTSDEAKDPGRIDMNTLFSLSDDLIVCTNIMISCINNFNKLVQAVNQNLRNVPNYEMHSKVNVEKYIYAYTMYLMELSRKYYNLQKGDKSRIFPIVAISPIGQAIEAETLFSELLDSDKTGGGLSIFVVNCPNYQRFANVCHVLPMISHEISHCFRFVERKARNEFVLNYLCRETAQEITFRLLDKAYGANREKVKDKAMQFVYEVIRDNLNEELSERLSEELAYIRMHNMRNVFVSHVRKCFGLSERNRITEKELWDFCKENLMELFGLCRISFIAPENVGGDRKNWGKDAVPNIVADIFNGDDEKISQWKEALDKAAGHPAFQECGNLADMQKMLSLYLKQGRISYAAVEKCLIIITKRMWKGYFPQDILSKIKNNKDAVNCMKKISGRIIWDTGFELQTDDLKALQGILELEEDDLFQLKQYILETAELSREILGKWKAYGEESVRNPNAKKKTEQGKKTEKELSVKIFENLQKEFPEKIKDPSENGWLVTQKIQRIYAKLGITGSRPELFEMHLQEALNDINSGYLEAVLEDRLKLYEEVFADLGMCKIFSFTPFGYFSYTIHVFMKEREMPMRSAYNLTEERIRLVCSALWGAEREREKPEDDSRKFEQGSERLAEEIRCYEEAVKNYEDDAEKNAKGIREIAMHKRMLRWMKRLYQDMKLDANLMLSEYDDFADYLRDIYKKHMDFLYDEKNETVLKIGAYYNNFTDNIGNPEEERSIANIQNDFVLKYYGKMQDAGIRVSSLEPKYENEEQDWEAAEYNRRFMKCEEET